MFIFQINSGFGGFGSSGGFQALGRGLVVRPNPLQQAVEGAITGFSAGSKFARTFRQNRLDKELEAKQREFLETQNPLFSLVKDPDEGIKMLIEEKKHLADLSSKYGHDERLEELKSNNERKLKEMELNAKGIQTKQQQEFDLHASLALNAAKTNSELKIQAAKLQGDTRLSSQEHNQKLIQMEETIMKNEALFMGFDAALDQEAKKRNISPALVESVKRSIRKGELTKTDRDALNLITGSSGAGSSSNAQAIIDALDEGDEEEIFTPGPAESNFTPTTKPQGGFSRLLGFD